MHPILFAADSIRQPSGVPFPVAHPDIDHSLIGSVSFADWSLHCAEADPLGSDRCRLHHRPGDGVGGDAMGGLPARLPAAAWNPWFELAGWPVYYPPAFFWWWFSFDAYAPAIFVEGGIIATSGGFLAIAAAILMSIIRAREARNVATYGSARWAEGKEIHAAGLLGPDGVVLGQCTR